ncbi:MAG: PKD domain-containing protein [Thiohalomonadales bacterium]
MVNTIVKYSILIPVFLFLVTACKHSDSSTETTKNSPTTSTNKLPIAVISDNQTVKSNTTITLIGTKSSDPDNDVLSYIWTFKSKPTLSNAKFVSVKQNNEIVSFDTDVIGEYIIELVVNDGTSNSKPATAVITRLNSKPIAILGKNRAVSLNSQVLLDGSASKAIDKQNLIYNWVLRSTPQGSTTTLVQNNPTDSSASFNADKEGEYVIDLTVNDGTESSLNDTVKIYSYNGTIVYFNDFSENTLSDFIIEENGTGKLLIENEQLRINPGKGYLNNAGIILDAAKLNNYNTQLSANIGLITWAFIISNEDGEFNNLFDFTLSSKVGMDDPATFGYSLSGGGYVGDRMMLSRIAHALSPYGSVLENIFDTTFGLSILPKIGAFKITFNPVNSEWKLYYKVGIQKIDPVLITNLIGSGINSGFVSQSLPFMILKGQSTGSTYFDHFAVIIKTTL